MAFQVNITSQLNQTTTASQVLHMERIAELHQCPAASITAFCMMIAVNATPEKRQKSPSFRDHFQKSMYRL
jgi:hypothetical protein